jgi:DNA-binding beta-propeller fold protein YncE
MEGAGSAVGYQLSNASYDSVSFSVASQLTLPTGIRFNDDGSKMYLVGRVSDSVFQYSLSTAFDLSTASYDTVTFSVASQETQPSGLFFKSDGTKMYVIGFTSDRAYQYTLSTAFDISTASYDSVNLYVGSQSADPSDIAFSSDGTKMYVVDNNTRVVYQYALSTAWDLSTASYASLSYTSGDSLPEGLAFNSDGTKLFVSNRSSNFVRLYNLSTAFDISTASAGISFSVSAQSSSPEGIAFNNDGTKMFIVASGTNTAYQYSTSTTSYTNQMDKTQLDAVTDPNHIALGNDLDLAIIFNMTSGTTVPSSDGVAINYDANVLNKGAVLGTDYDFDAPTTSSVRITALAANNLKVRVV